MSSPEANLREQMQALSAEAWDALEQRQWQAAEDAYTRAVQIAHDLGDGPVKSLMLSYRGLARKRAGKVEQARTDMDDALLIALDEQVVQLIAHVNYLIGELEADEGNDERAVERLWVALDAAMDAGDQATAEVSLGKIGHIYMQMGWLEPASECFRQALEHAEGSPNRVAWLGNLGQTLSEMGRLEESISYYRQALQEAQVEGDARTQAKCVASEGLSHFHQEQYQEALECFQKALQLSQEEEDLEGKATWLGNLGNVYLKLGATDEAQRLVEQGLEIAKQLHDKHAEAAHLDSLGDCFLHKGDFQEALKHYTDALSIGQSIFDRLGERIYRANVGRAYKRLGDTEAALKHLRDAIELFDQQRSRIHSDALKTSFASHGQDLYREMILLCLESGKRVEALEYVGRAKSRAILDLLRNSPIDITELRNVNDESITKLVERERELSSQIARLERIYGQAHGDSDGSHRGATISAEDAPKLYGEWREVVDQLRRRHHNYASMVAVDTLTFEELRALWSADTSGHSCIEKTTAVLEFYLTDDFLFSAAVWHGAEQPATHFVLDKHEIHALNTDIADLLEMSATEGWEVPVSLCKRIFRRLVGNILESAPAEIDTLILVPHGVLHRVPFAALHTGTNYLVEKFNLSYLPTSSLIPVLAGRESEESSQDRLKYLVSAISDYSATRSDGIVFSSRLRSAAGLDDLSYTLEEGKTVYSLAQQITATAKLLTNEEVKDGLLQLFSDFPVVHFAGHAVFNPDEPLASGLVLSDGSILTAARILQDNALRTKCGKLLVLSACQTGVNVITNGGEILGLARALMYAGMPNLILSLWEVADRSTAELMQSFHTNWQAGKQSIAEALSTAQRKAITEGQPIHAWAPFIHLGID